MQARRAKVLPPLPKEVRELGQRSAQAARDIKDLIRNSRQVRHSPAKSSSFAVESSSFIWARLVHHLLSGLLHHRTLLGPQHRRRAGCVQESPAVWGLVRGPFQPQIGKSSNFCVKIGGLEPATRAPNKGAILKQQAVVKDMLDKLIDSHVAHGNQLIAMQTLAALILVEISSSKPDPEQYLLQASAQLTGLADMTARAREQTF